MADAERKLVSILTESFLLHADMVEFEYDSEGLEVTHFCGNTGMGKVLKGRELAAEIMAFVDSKSKNGRLELSIQGSVRTMRVQWYDSFGESCLRPILPSGEAASLPDDDSDMPAFMAECQGCDEFAEINDLGLCDGCAEKLERDLIRKCDWDYTMAGFGLPESEREAYRQKVIAEFGEGLELLAADPPTEMEPRSSPTAARKPRGKRKAKRKRNR